MIGKKREGKAFIFREFVCLLLAVALAVSCGAVAEATPEHYIHISDLTYPAEGMTPSGFFLIFTVSSDLEDVELYDYSFATLEGENVECFEGGSTYCLWLHIRRMEGQLPQCQVLVEGEAAEEIVTTAEEWLIKKTFTVPAAPKEDPPVEYPEAPAAPETPTEPDVPTEPETPTEPKPEIIPDPAPLPEEIPDVSQKEENVPQLPPEEPDETPESSGEEAFPQEPTEPEETLPEQEEEKPTDPPEEPAEKPEMPEDEKTDSTDEQEKPENDENNSTDNEINDETVGNPSTDKKVEILRIAGKNRYETAFAAADAYKSLLQTEQFTAVLVASGTAFPDALSGSYLASACQAPILLVKPGKEQQVKDYIRENLCPGGTVYLLGGENAVPRAMEDLAGFAVKRLGGADRYETNLRILEEIGVSGQDIMVCTGKHYADALCAAGTGLPVLLVKDRLTDGQKELLRHASGRIFLAGGEMAVSKTLETQLAQFAAVERLAGNTRYETSVLLARRFFEEPERVVLASGENFPDALTAGVIACAMDAPLLLTRPGSEAAGNYGKSLNVRQGFVLGGTAVLPEDAVQAVFKAGQW